LQSSHLQDQVPKIKNNSQKSDSRTAVNPKVSKFENQKQNPRKSENQKIKKNLVLLSSRYELIRL